MLSCYHGSIFDIELLDRVDAIVNPVNCKGVMGKGLALEFKNRYPNNFELYTVACRTGQLIVGQVNVNINLEGNPKWIVNFPTKDDWRDSSKLIYIENGLRSLSEYINKSDIRSIAMPKLGCGLGGLKWSRVQALIKIFEMSLFDCDVIIVE